MAADSGKLTALPVSSPKGQQGVFSSFSPETCDLLAATQPHGVPAKSDCT